MSWVLMICTAGWIMCGQQVEVVYPTEAACYRALDELYKRNPRDSFKYVLCKPRKAAAPESRTGEG